MPSSLRWVNLVLLSAPLWGPLVLAQAPQSHFPSLEPEALADEALKGAAGALAKPPGPGVKGGCCPSPPPSRASPPEGASTELCAKRRGRSLLLLPRELFSHHPERDSQMAAAEPWQKELCFLSPPPAPPGSSVSESAVVGVWGWLAGDPEGGSMREREQGGSKPFCSGHPPTRLVARRAAENEQQAAGR